MTGKRGIAYIILFDFLILAVFANAEDAGLSWRAVTDWEKNELRLTIEAPVARSGLNLPAADRSAERAIARSLPRIFAEAAYPLIVDSRSRVGEWAEADTSLGGRLLGIAEAGKKGLPVNSRDLTKVTVEYSYPLHELLGGLFIRHSRPRDIPRALGWRPSKEFSGIVVYAKGELPVHGEAFSARIQPCLFPEIFDDEMNPVLLHEMGDPGALGRWGSAAYTSSFDEGPWRDRIGANPLRIIAVGLFGRYPTDPIISREDAARILTIPGNRRLLAEGRVLIIRDPDKP